jgi:hypothetical protein
MYPYLYPPASAPPVNQYNTGANNNASYGQGQSQNRQYHIPSEQRMVGFEKFMRRYESRLRFPMTIFS